ncbi:hypothetical protein [Micromonospora sp. NPDC005806]
MPGNGPGRTSQVGRGVAEAITFLVTGRARFVLGVIRPAVGGRSAV